MELRNFDDIMRLLPKDKKPMRVVLAGSDGENMLKGLFKAQKEGIAQPILVGEPDSTKAMLKKLDLEKEPYTMVELPHGHTVAQAAIDVILAGDGDVLMRGNIPTHDFLIPVMDKNNGLRTDRTMTHVSLISLPGYPKLLAMSDMTVVIKPNLMQKRAIIQNTADVLRIFGVEDPKLAVLSLVENVTFHMQDTVEAQRLVADQKRKHFANCELWGPISYDLIFSKEAAEMKGYDCPWCGGGFDGLIAPDLSTANTPIKSWILHAGAATCGAVVGAKVPVALTSRSSDELETYRSLVFCSILDEWKKNNKK